MSRKTLIMGGMIIGSIIGGYLPVLFGVSVFSFISILGNGIGGILGIAVALKFTQDL